MNILALALDAGAAYRLTRLVTQDTILDEPRGAVVDWSDGAPPHTPRGKVAELVQCRWCTGMWISLGIVAARRYAPRAWTPIATALTLSAAAALLARLED